MPFEPWTGGRRSGTVQVGSVHPRSTISTRSASVAPRSFADGVGLGTDAECASVTVSHPYRRVGDAHEENGVGASGGYPETGEFGVPTGCPQPIMFEQPPLGAGAAPERQRPAASGWWPGEYSPPAWSRRSGALAQQRHAPAQRPERLRPATALHHYAGLNSTEGLWLHRRVQCWGEIRARRNPEERKAPRGFF